MWVCGDFGGQMAAGSRRYIPTILLSPYHWAPSRPATATATSTSRWVHFPLARNLALREVPIMRHDNLSETSLVRVETPDHRVMLKALG